MASSSSNSSSSSSSSSRGKSLKTTNAGKCVETTIVKFCLTTKTGRARKLARGEERLERNHRNLETDVVKE